MRTPPRLAAALVALLTTVLLSACGSIAAPSVIPSTASEPRSAAPSASIEREADVAARLSYSAAMCPIFSGILELDPRLQLWERLREKIEPNPVRPRYVKTVWGVGYKLEP